MKNLTIGILLLFIFNLTWAQQDDCYVGTTMGFTLYLQNTCGIVYKEDGIAKNPFQSVKDHGGTIIRLRQDLPPYSNSYVENEPPVDFRSPIKVKEGMEAASEVELKTLLTYSYQSFALEASESLNPYVAPLAWQPIANELDKLTDSVYNYTFQSLDYLINSGSVPDIVSIGNETNWHILTANVPEASLPTYSPQRTITLLNAGAEAVRDINEAYNLNIKIALHIFGASNLQWWMNTHVPLGLDFDIMGLSHYHAWHSMGDFANWTEVVDWVQSNYQKDFMILETAQLFSTGYSDNRVNILGTDNIPNGYPNPPTTSTQKDYLTDLTREILEAGGLGTIVWGGEWVGSDCYIYPDAYGPGSSWENKTFWDFSNNLHDGINWMEESCNYNSIDDNTTGNLFTIYPVPFKDGFITIESLNGTINEVSIFSILGEQVLFFQPESNNSLSLKIKLPSQKFPSGNYILQILNEAGSSYFYKIPVL